MSFNVEFRRVSDQPDDRVIRRPFADRAVFYRGRIDRPVTIL